VAAPGTLAAQPPAAVGYYDKLGVLYLQMILDALRRAQGAINRLETNWRELPFSEKRRLFGMVTSALGDAETSVSAVASWRGSVGRRFQAQMKLLRERYNKEESITKKFAMLKEKKSMIEKAMLDSDVLLEPKDSAQDIYDEAVGFIVSNSEPVTPDEIALEEIEEGEDDEPKDTDDLYDGIDDLDDEDEGGGDA